MALRGALLRDLTRLSMEIQAASAAHTRAQERLDAAMATKKDLLARIKAADEEYEALQATKKRESENDSELVSLQQRVSLCALTRTNTAKAVIAARAERDAAREKATLAHYMCQGLASEVLRVHAATAPADEAAAARSSQTVGRVWTQDGVALLREAESLWKRSSINSMMARDVLAAALALHQRRLDTGTHTHTHTPPRSVAGSVPVLQTLSAAPSFVPPLVPSGSGPAAYAAAHASVASEASKCVCVCEDTHTEAQAVRKRVTALKDAMTRVMSHSSAAHTETSVALAKRAAQVLSSLSSVESVCTHIHTHTRALRTLLSQIKLLLDAAAPPVPSDTTAASGATPASVTDAPGGR